LEIQIQSVPGKGTRFSVILPTTDAEESALPSKSRPTLPPRIALDGLSVICIDNDERILDGMKLLLERWGCQVSTFSGAAAFRAAVSRPQMPDIILADYHLNGETGLDAIRELRRAYHGDVAAVLVTADRSTEVRAAADALGVPIINKPVKPAVLRQMMSRVRGMAAAAE
ncbi:MAG TPA: response regulator, partial [Rhizobiaceae bacterium]|nr:response regulator [Rhizobiaceae bacterium]